ncbi:MAG: T9SS type A sorting domain-containing protein, partial [Candidatus Edwardsbacteria bacterium]|nr:T9SS type A sorting domain-containing protein [Candidatus Edwardsbacteria bacterium]
VTHHNIPVTLTIDSAGTQVYEATSFVTLGTGASDYAIPAASWSACTTPGVVYTLKAWVNWPLDQDGANDTVTVTSTIVDAVWSQYEPIGTDAHASQRFEAGMEAYECWIVDDFWISGPDSLWLDSIYVHGQYWNGTGPMDSVQLMLLPDSASGYPAFSTPLWTGYFTPAAYTDSSGTLKLRFPQQLKVYGNNPGMWLTVQAHLTFSTNGQWGWTRTQDQIRGSYVGWWYNPGGGFGVGSAYVPVSSVWTGTTDHSFVLFGGLTPSGAAGNPAAVPPAPFALQPAHPNPARGRTTFDFNLPKAGGYRIDVYNLAGQRVHGIIGTGRAGGNSVGWNPGSTAAGVYIYRLTAGGRSATGKLVLVK